jgi:hypothetical protein
VTGYDGDVALEAALIDGDAASGPFEVTNGLLLRGDVRTLFDLNLIRIHPRTRKVYLADALKKSRYARYWARQLRLPEDRDSWPSAEALERRWDAGGG